MRHRLPFSCAFALLVLTGCQPGNLEGLGKDVVVRTLPAGDSAGRHEATLVATAEGTYSTYMGLLLTRASERCSGGSFGIDEATYGPDIDDLVPAGETLRMVVSCNHNRLPNHRVVAADDMSLFGRDVPEGSLSKSASQQLVQHRGNERLALESLLGGFLRQAYTEQCAGKAVLVEYIGSATSPGTPDDRVPDPENMQATLQFRCVDQPS